MKRSVAAMFASLLPLSACGGDAAKSPAAAPSAPVSTPAVTPAEPPAESPKPASAVNMDADIAVLMAKPEQPDESIEIQHILIAFKGAPRMTKVTRSKEEAKALAEKIYAEVIGGGDFEALIKQHTDDSFPGKYPVTKAGRKGFVKGFGDVGFRLKVGEIGVAPWSADASPFGWHIIRRLE